MLVSGAGKDVFSCPWLFIHVYNLERVFSDLFEVLRPSQPNGVMSSAVSLPNHTFTGQT